MAGRHHPEDFDPPGTPRIFYAICATPRSGSTLLADRLWRTGRMGAPQEYFSLQGGLLRLARAFECDHITHYVDEVFRRRTSANGVFATKLFYPDWVTLTSYNLLPRFPGLKLIHLRRRDRVAQAVSHRIAAQSGQWHSGQEKRAEPSYDFDHVLRSLKVLNGQEHSWTQLFNHFKERPLELVYEDIVGDLNHHVERIVRHVGGDVGPASTPPERPSIEQQASSLNAEWAERFRADFEVWQRRTGGGGERTLRGRDS